ncbi:MAG: hypothetical protein AAGE52_01430 [Myxococcota bacterium]
MTSKREDLFDALRHLEEMEDAESVARGVLGEPSEVPKHRKWRNAHACSAATKSVRRAVIRSFLSHFHELGIDPKEWGE